jgi:hypothetical protein
MTTVGQLVIWKLDALGHGIQSEFPSSLPVTIGTVARMRGGSRVS